MEKMIEASIEETAFLRNRPIDPQRYKVTWIGEPNSVVLSVTGPRSPTTAS